MSIDSNALFADFKHRHGIVFEDTFRAGANYEVAVEDGDVVYVSGQLPRMHGAVQFPGRVGAEVTLESAQQAARICVLRAIAVLQQTLGDLNRVKKIRRITVYVQSAADFTQQSEVADAASEILYAVFAPAGGHTRTSVGVYQLPKNGSVELDLIAAIEPAD